MKARYDRGYAQGITGAERGTGDMYRGREGMTGKVQRVMGMMKISKGTGNSKVSCAEAIRGGKLNLAYYVNKQEVYGPHCSPENQSLAIKL